MTFEATITYKSGSVNAMRGYSSVEYESGGVSFYWSDTGQEVWINLTEVIDIVYQEVEE